MPACDEHIQELIIFLKSLKALASRYEFQPSFGIRWLQSDGQWSDWKQLMQKKLP